MIDSTVIYLVFGLASGTVVGFLNERLTYLCLGQILRREMARLRPVVLFLSIGFYVSKYGILGLAVYVLVNKIASAGEPGSRETVWPFLLGLAIGIMVYQIGRSVIMLGVCSEQHRG